MPEPTSPHGAASTPGGGPKPGVDPVTDAVDQVCDSLRDWAEAAKASYGKAIDGRYTAQDLAGDMAGMAARTVQGWARVFTGAAEVAGWLATRPMKPPAPPDKGADAGSPGGGETTSTERDA